MKTKVFLFFIGITLFSCTTTKSVLKKDIYPGMTIPEFKKEVPKAVLHSFNDTLSIYRLDANIWVQYDDTPQFFYFKNGKLTRTDRGEREVDHRSREDINVNINHKKVE